MRPTRTVLSEMPGAKSYQGWWGSLGSHGQKHIAVYSISPYKQRAFAGAMHGYIFNGYRRIMKHLPYWLIPVSIGYAVYSYGDSRYAYLQSKAGHAETEGGEH
ncbi:hypothetical protein AURDEDRAFT_181618 [Auricularia subglabra TFB-10046 SS5]|nr:hypothetical protein AURDEDRAFT_181618 [Auricularia subglabra TFB-10046 SS5]